MTVAGTVGGGLPATDIINYGLGTETGVAIGTDGAMYICQGGTIGRVDPTTGLETVIAGAAPTGYSNASGVPANSTYAYCGSGITFDPITGNIAFSSSTVVRVIAQTTGTFLGQSMVAGDVYTVAGDGAYGSSGDGGPATSAALYVGPLAFDQQGNLIVTGQATNTNAGETPPLIRVVAGSTGTFYGQSMSAGDIYTIAGNGTTEPTSSGTPAASTSIGNVSNITVDGQGNIFVAGQMGCYGCNNQYEVGVVIAESTGTFYGESMTTGDAYALFLNMPANQDIVSYPSPDVSGNLVFPAETQTCTQAQGQTTCTESGEYIDVYAESSGTFYGQSMTAGNLYTIAGDGQAGYSGDAGPATAAGFGSQYYYGTVGVIVSPTSGDVYVGDVFDEGTPGYPDESPTAIRVIAEQTTPSYGQAMTVGDIYRVAGCGGPDCNGNGLPALSAVTGGPNGNISDVVVDSSGNTVYLDDSNHYIRVVPSSSGTLFGQSMTAGDVYTIVGNGDNGYYADPQQTPPADGTPGTEVPLGYSQELAVDGSGNVLFEATRQGVIELLAASTGTFYGQSMTAGDVYAIAGGGDGAYPGDGSPALGATINADAMAVDQAGNVLIADGTGFVRVVAASTGSFYGQSMTAGDVYTIAGSGSQSYTGNSGKRGNLHCSPRSLRHRRRRSRQRRARRRHGERHLGPRREQWHLLRPVHVPW